MSSYAVDFTKSAHKEISKLPLPTARRIAQAIDKLSVDPKKGKVRPMVGSKSWRLRVGDYRVIYDISDSELVILVIRIRHRREVYRK
jgi:mRNA interferase RelE/StbE